MKTIFFLLTFSICNHSYAQTGGFNSFQLLDLSFNARSSGLGGDFISVLDKDVNLGVSNPSLLNPEMNKVLSFNTAFLAGRINYGMLSYGIHTKKAGTIAPYIKYVNYGEFQRTSIAGENEGTFTPVEMIVGGAIGKAVNKRISLGANVNFLYSQLETYNAIGASLDFAGTFYNKEEEFLFTVIAKNIGYQLTTYTEDIRAPLPAEIQMAVSYKLKHAPFRFSLLGHHLNNWDITYIDPNLKATTDPLTGLTIPAKNVGFFTKLAHHFTYQLEILIGKNIEIRAAYDFHRRKELALEERSGISGFSFGAGFIFNKFSLDYGFVIYSRAGYNNVITLSTNFSKWKI